MKKLVVQPAETITSALQKIRFWPELGDYIDLQMAPAVILSQINPDQDKNRIFREIIIFLKNPKLSARANYLLL